MTGIYTPLRTPFPPLTPSFPSRTGWLANTFFNSGDDGEAALCADRPKVSLEDNEIMPANPHLLSIFQCAQTRGLFSERCVRLLKNPHPAGLLKSATDSRDRQLAIL